MLPACPRFERLCRFDLICPSRATLSFRATWSFRAQGGSSLYGGLSSLPALEMTGHNCSRRWNRCGLWAHRILPADSSANPSARFEHFLAFRKHAFKTQRGQRATEQKALQMFALLFAQETEVIFSLYAFGDHK